MSNKLFLLPFFGVLIPLLTYTSVLELQQRSHVSIKSVGETVSFSTSTAPDITSDPVVFTGDVLLARNVEHYLKTKGSGYPFVHMSNLFADASVVIGNFESAVLKNHHKTPSYVTTFSVDAQFLPDLAKAGFTHVSLANNHALDYGEDTFAHTLIALASSSIQTVGHPQVVATSSVMRFTSGDYTFGLLALNQIGVSINWADIEAQLSVLSQTTDYQIAYVHWGDEYVLKHNLAQEDLAKKLIDAGTDAVIGHHPHVTQDIQIYKGKPIFYSLGNFIFDQYFSVDVQEGLLLSLTLSTSTAQFNLTPITSAGTPSQPHRMDEVDRALFLKNLSRRSDPIYAENIASGMLILPLNLATYP